MLALYAMVAVLGQPVEYGDVRVYSPETVVGYTAFEGMGAPYSKAYVHFSVGGFGSVGGCTFNLYPSFSAILTDLDDAGDWSSPFGDVAYYVPSGCFLFSGGPADQDVYYWRGGSTNYFDANCNASCATGCTCAGGAEHVEWDLSWALLRANVGGFRKVICPGDCVDLDTVCGGYDWASHLGFTRGALIVHPDADGVGVVQCDPATDALRVDGETNVWWMGLNSVRCIIFGETSGCLAGNQAEATTHWDSLSAGCPVDPTACSGGFSQTSPFTFRLVIDWDDAGELTAEQSGIEHIVDEIGALAALMGGGGGGTPEEFWEANPFEGSTFGGDSWSAPGVPAGGSFQDLGTAIGSLPSMIAESDSGYIKTRSMGPLDDLMAIDSNARVSNKFGGTGSAPSLSLPLGAVSGGAVDDVPISFTGLKSTLHAIPAWMGMRTALTLGVILAVGVMCGWIVLWAFGFVPLPWG